MHQGKHSLPDDMERGIRTIHDYQLALRAILAPYQLLPRAKDNEHDGKRKRT